MQRYSWATCFVVALFAPLVTAAQQPPDVQAQKPKLKITDARPMESPDGKTNFEAYCAACHGTDGKGKGPALDALKVPPPDLTTYTKRYGKFSRTDIEAMIKGEGPEVAAHGSRDMPIWGPVFRSMTSDQGLRTLRITNLVNYIEGLQAR
jgi:mono/diheme cytochrome c family protein